MTGFAIGQTNVSLYFEGINLTDNSPATGLTVTTIDMHYTREREEEVIDTATSALADQDSAHTDGGIIEISAGLYRADYPDDAFLTGVKFVVPRLIKAGYYFRLVDPTELTGSDPRAGAITDYATSAELATVNDFLDTEITTILTELGEIDTMLATLATAANLATAKTAIDAIKAKTDQLTFTIANKLNANTQYMNDTLVNGNGTSGNKWRG